MDNRQASALPSPERIERLVREHYAFVWRLLRRLGLPAGDADDAAQQVFLIATNRLGDIAVERERSFLYGVALNIASRVRRSQTRRREDPIEGASNRPDSRPNAEQLLQRHEARQMLDALLSQMPDELRVVFVLFEIEEFTTAQIAELCQIPVGTAASRLRRARADFEQRVARLDARRRFSGGES